MAAGLVTVPVVDIEGGGVIRNMQYWSSDGTVNGALSLAISTGGSAGPGLMGVKGADGATIAGPSNGLSVLGTKLNDGSQSSVGGTHLTMGGVDPATNVYRPLQLDSVGRMQVKSAGASYADISVASLNAGQAAGTSTVIAADANRRSLMINPPADCFLALAASATSGYPLIGGLPNTLVGQECPTNALYVGGLALAQTLTVWSA